VRDFASFLDELPPATEEPGRGEAVPDIGFGAPSMPFAFVGGAGVAAPDAAGRGAAVRAGLAATAYGGIVPDDLARESAPRTAPETIARELAIDPRADLKSLDRLRREFAFRNHPDRVRPEWRESAMIRMQIANRLIDEAKARLARRDTSGRVDRP
jgi:hypothetical protein